MNKSQILTALVLAGACMSTTVLAAGPGGNLPGVQDNLGTSYRGFDSPLSNPGAPLTRMPATLPVGGVPSSVTAGRPAVTPVGGAPTVNGVLDTPAMSKGRVNSRALNQFPK